MLLKSLYLNENYLYNDFNLFSFKISLFILPFNFISNISFLLPSSINFNIYYRECKTYQICTNFLHNQIYPGFLNF